MYSRNGRGGNENAPDFGLTGFRLPPRYDGSRFRRSPPHERPPEGRPAPPPARPPEKPPAGPPRPDEDGARERIRSLFGEKLGSEELMILSLILILSAAGGDGCDSPGEVILLLALLLTAAS